VTASTVQRAAVGDTRLMLLLMAWNCRSPGYSQAAYCLQVLFSGGAARIRGRPAMRA